jgi:hypothetical protein
MRESHAAAPVAVALPRRLDFDATQEASCPGCGNTLILGPAHRGAFCLGDQPGHCRARQGRATIARRTPCLSSPTNCFQPRWRVMSAGAFLRAHAGWGNPAIMRPVPRQLALVQRFWSGRYSS